MDNSTLSSSGEYDYLGSCNIVTETRQLQDETPNIERDEVELNVFTNNNGCIPEPERRNYESTEDEDDVFSNSSKEDYNMYNFTEWNHDTRDSVDVRSLQNTILFEASNVTAWEAFNMVNAVTLKYNLSDEVQQAFLNLLKILAGPDFENLNTTKYTMNKLFNPPRETVAYIFYCETCNIPLSSPISKNKININNDQVLCQKCKKLHTLTTTQSNFFLTINLKNQLEDLLKTESFRDMLKENYTRQEQHYEYTITDIQDSDRYRNDKYIQSKKANREIVLTLNVNADGTPQFESGRHSLWPIQCIINEIPKELRSKYVLLAALWYTKSEPTPQFMNMYLGALIAQIQNLMEEGIQIESEEGETITYYCKIFSFPVDSVARPVMQNRLQFNGRYACSWCYIKSTYNSNYMRFIQSHEIPVERSHNVYLKDVRKRRKDVKRLRKTKKNSKYTVYGIKGRSVLSSLHGFDCIWGYPHDYMHGVLLGVTRQLWYVWSSDQYLNATDRRLINQRLLQIKPPKEIHRVPRILKNKNKWKATEWRSWLLFYSIPCLTDVLNKEVLDSYTLLVKSMHKLLTLNITEDELLECEIDLLTFVHDCQNLYGESFMTFNVHTLLHLTESVRKNGPLWATSSYPFESNIYHLKNNATGPNRTLRRNAFRNYLSITENNSAWDFCKRMFTKRKEINTNYDRASDGAILVKDKSTNSNTRYNRCIYKGTVYHSILYTKAKKTDNTYLYLGNNRMGKVLCFYLLDNMTHIEVDIIKIDNLENLRHIWKVGEFEKKTILPMTDVVSKLVFINVNNAVATDSETLCNNYVCIEPNNIEVQ